MGVRHGVKLASQIVTNSILSVPTNPENTATAISIVSNSRLLSDGLLSLLSLHFSLHLIDTYPGDFQFQIDACLPNPPGHVVLLDNSVGHPIAITWIQHWRRLNPPAYVLILELANDMHQILACIEAGASGYILQGASAIEVVKAIKDATCGVAHCSPEVTAQLFARMTSLRSTINRLSISPLTKRETDILRLIAADYTNLEIANHLTIELRTVKQHVHNILGKLNSRNRREAARLAIDQGWLGNQVSGSA